MGHIDLSVRTGALPSCFIIANGNEEEKLSVCKDLHHFVMYPFKNKRELADMLKMDPVVLPPYSIIVVHGHLNHAGVEYVDSNYMRYDIYIYPDDVNLQDGIVFAYEWSLDVAKEIVGNRFFADADAY